MSLECGECERDLRGKHAPGCSRRSLGDKRSSTYQLRKNMREAAPLMTLLNSVHPLLDHVDEQDVTIEALRATLHSVAAKAKALRTVQALRGLDDIIQEVEAVLAKHGGGEDD